MARTSFLPAFFEQMLGETYGADDVSRIVEGCFAERPVTLRANTLLATQGEVAEALTAAGLEFDRVGWYDDAFVIRDVRERAIWDLPLYQQGKVYLQSLSSMIPALALGAQPGTDVCDMCAAPGGKTTQIAALTGNRAYITACEMHAPRAEKLEHNLRKLGAPNVQVMRTDARTLDDFFSFDYVLLDAPCSGSGTLRAEDPRTAKRFTQALVSKSIKAQKALFAKALGLLKPGATLVYSTCSVLPCENDDIVGEGLRRARRKGTFEVLPLIAEAKTAEDGAAPEAPAAPASAALSASQAAPSGSPAPSSEPASSGSPAPFATDMAADLPLLPTSIPGTICLAPTDRYEGFYLAKIKRTA